MNRSASPVTGILGRIVESKRREAAALAPRTRELRRAAEAAATARGFEAALRSPVVALIAEFKRRSPTAGALAAADAEVGGVARSYEAGGGSALSVLTDGEFFGGALADLAAARSATRLPVLRKDFILVEAQVWESRAVGADAVLLIARILDDARLKALVDLARELGMGALVEVHDAVELSRALSVGATVIGINNRDLDTFTTSLEVSLSLAPSVPADRVVVAESGITLPSDVDRLGAAGVDAVLVGEALMRSGDARAGALALAGRPRSARASDSGVFGMPSGGSVRNGGGNAPPAGLS